MWRPCDRLVARHIRPLFRKPASVRLRGGGLMTIRRAALSLASLFTVALSAIVAAQGGDGSLRGIVNDEQGSAIPGVTVTATSPQVIAPAVAVTDASGEYRLNNLPPGTYTLTMELSGFS